MHNTERDARACPQMWNLKYYGRFKRRFTCEAICLIEMVVVEAVALILVEVFLCCEDEHFAVRLVVWGLPEG